MIVIEHVKILGGERGERISNWVFFLVCNVVPKSI